MRVSGKGWGMEMEKQNGDGRCVGGDTEVKGSKKSPVRHRLQLSMEKFSHKYGGTVGMVKSDEK